MLDKETGGEKRKDGKSYSCKERENELNKQTDK
jgi:hypothetical protein